MYWLISYDTSSKITTWNAMDTLIPFQIQDMFLNEVFEVYTGDIENGLRLKLVACTCHAIKNKI